jgi:hypothetical protein
VSAVGWELDPSPAEESATAMDLYRNSGAPSTDDPTNGATQGHVIRHDIVPVAVRSDNHCLLVVGDSVDEAPGEGSFWFLQGVTAGLHHFAAL